MATPLFTRSARSRRLKVIVLLSILLLALLASCAPASPQAATPQPVVNTPVEPSPTAGEGVEPLETPNTNTGAGAGAGAPFTVDFLEQLEPDQVLVQLAEEPTFVLPEWRYEFGRVPPFTLLADGRLIYLDETSDFSVMVAQLTPEETVAMLNKVHELGFSQLEDYTDMCMKTANGEENCVADASFRLLRARTDANTLKEIRNYADFSNKPEINQAITTLLTEFDNTSAVQYVPTGATLFVRPMPDAGGMTPLEFPLDPALLTQSEGKPEGFIATALDEEQVKSYLSKLTRIGGQEVFEYEGKFYSGRLVPWLPGMDYTEEIKNTKWQ